MKVHSYVKFIGILLIVIIIIAVVVINVNGGDGSIKKFSDKVKDGIGKLFAKYSINNFKNLKLGMSVKEVKQKVGEPTSLDGSGLVILRYELKDGTVVYLNFGSGKELNSVSVEYKNGESEVLMDINKNNN